MEFTINLQIDCTPRLEALIASLTSITEKAAAPVEAKTEAPVSEKPAKKDEATHAEPVAEAPKPAEPRKPESAPTEITDEAIRAAFTACKARLLGNHPDANPLKRKVVKKAKEYLKSIGAENLCEIPQDKRQEFVDLCEIMTIETEETEAAPY